MEREKEVLCEPHLKLIRRDSDLRIYFWWCDDKIGEGQKVLVGHIGRHPYWENRGFLLFWQIGGFSAGENADRSMPGDPADRLSENTL